MGQVLSILGLQFSNESVHVRDTDSANLWEGACEVQRGTSFSGRRQEVLGYQAQHSVVIIPEQVFLENWEFLTMKHDFLVPMDSH